MTMNMKTQTAAFDLPAYMSDVGARARAAGRLMAKAESAAKNAALLAMAD